MRPHPTNYSEPAHAVLRNPCSPPSRYSDGNLTAEHTRPHHDHRLRCGTPEHLARGPSPPVTHRRCWLDAIETMRQTGNDMSDRYDETSAGGLAINVVECSQLQRKSTRRTHLRAGLSVGDAPASLRQLTAPGVRAEHFVVDVLARYVPRDQRVAHGAHEG